MACPFYACNLAPNFGLVENRGSNQCALITDEHSPCYMEVFEKRSPDWIECPRNPMFTSLLPGTPTEPTFFVSFTEPVPAETSHRFLKHWQHMLRLQR